MSDLNPIRLQLVSKLNKALERLEYSYQKVIVLSPHTNDLDQEGFEVWESFSARFSRLTDIFLSRYLRLCAMQSDPAFRGTFRDYLDLAEKMGVIESSDYWFSIRELRNKVVHDYSDEDTEIFFKAIRAETPKVLQGIRNAIQSSGSR